MTPETFRSSGLRDIAMKRKTTSSIAFPERLRNRTPRTEPPLNTSHQWQPLKVQASPRLGQCCGMAPEDVRLVVAGGDEFWWSAGLYRIEIRKPLERSRLQQRLHGGGMKFLLTSAGIKNTSINDALVDLLGKPIAESIALFIPTASYGHPIAGLPVAWNCIS